MITIQYDDGGVSQSLSLGIESLSDLGPILRKFAKYKRGQVEKVFQQQGPGWAPLAESTMEHRQQKAAEVGERFKAQKFDALRRKIEKEGARAEKSLNKSKAGLRADLLEKRLKVVQRHAVVKAETFRLMAGEEGPAPREARKVGERVQRAAEGAAEKLQRYESGELLGAMARSIYATVEGKMLTIESKIAWSGVHNDGGTAGHGARIPQREFLAWTPEDLKALAEIAVQHAAAKVMGT